METGNVRQRYRGVVLSPFATILLAERLTKVERKDGLWLATWKGDWSLAKDYALRLYVDRRPPLEDPPLIYDFTCKIVDRYQYTWWELQTSSEIHHHYTLLATITYYSPNKVSTIGDKPPQVNNVVETWTIANEYKGYRKTTTFYLIFKPLDEPPILS